MLQDFLNKTAEVIATSPKSALKPRALASKLASELGTDESFLEKVFSDPAEAQQLLGKHYLRLSALLADHLASLIATGELSASETIAAIPAVSRTARLFMGEATDIIDSPTKVLLEVLQEEEETTDNPKELD